MDREEIRIRIEWRGEKFEWTGDPEEAVRQTEMFLMKTIPEISLAKRLRISIDAKDLAEIIFPLIKITPENKVIMTFPTRKVSVTDRILTVLIGQKFLHLSGVSQRERLGLSELAEQVLSSTKSTSSRLSELFSIGLVDKDRSEEGIEYGVTIKGILNFKDSKISKILRKVATTK